MFRHLIVFLLVLLASGCAQRLQQPAQPVNLPAQLVRLDAIKQWEIKGKMAIKEPEQSLSANLRWQVDNQLFSFRLSNFLGVTLVDMEQTAQGAKLEADDEVYTDTSASTLLYRMTGWHIPLNQLLNWIKGVPLPEDNYELDENGLMKQLSPACAQCAGWVVDYSRYGQVGDVFLPHNIVLTNPNQPGQWIKIRISQWTLK